MMNREGKRLEAREPRRKDHREEAARLPRRPLPTLTEKCSPKVFTKVIAHSGYYTRGTFLSGVALRLLHLCLRIFRPLCIRSAKCCALFFSALEFPIGSRKILEDVPCLRRLNNGSNLPHA